MLAALHPYGTNQRVDASISAFRHTLAKDRTVMLDIIISDAEGFQQGLEPISRNFNNMNLDEIKESSTKVIQVHSVMLRDITV